MPQCPTSRTGFSLGYAPGYVTNTPTSTPLARRRPILTRMDANSRLNITQALICTEPAIVALLNLARQGSSATLENHSLACGLSIRAPSENLIAFHIRSPITLVIPFDIRLCARVHYNIRQLRSV